MSDVSQPFDEVANAYDQSFSDTRIGKLQRWRVHVFLKPILDALPEKNILELNCGTGVDALWLAANGCLVKATDSSLEMVQICQQKSAAAKFEQQIIVAQMSIQQINQLSEDEKYDLIFSNFGGFNCLSPEELKESAAAFSNHLKPGGHLVAVVMTDFCLWESLYFGAKFSFRKIFRRKRKGPLSVSLGNGNSINTWYYSPDGFADFFKDRFQKESLFPVGFAIPPSYLNERFKKHPKLLNGLDQLERHCQNFTWAGKAADHFFLHLIKKQ